MRSAELEAQVVERTPISGHVGKSGATLERWLLADGSRVVVKRVRPAKDLLGRLTRDDSVREYAVWAGGLLDHLPDGVGHAVLEGWREPGGACLVMRDLDGKVLTWDDRLDRQRTGWLMQHLAGMHRAFADLRLSPWREVLTPLPAFYGMFAPERMRPYVDGESELPGLAIRGWEHFERLVPHDVGRPVLGLLHDPAPLARALLGCPCTVVHGDVATVNLAVDGESLVLLDWGVPAAAPGAVDVARFIAGCSSVVDLSREATIEAYAAAAGPSYHEGAMRLALLAAFVWLGWNKALDAAEHPDPMVRDREREDLEWWVGQARRALRAGLL
jgi:hypothetical protein